MAIRALELGAQSSTPASPASGRRKLFLNADGELCYLTNTGVVERVGSVGSSDIEITDATKGVILRAPDGGRWRLTIDSTGILNTTRL